MKVILDTNILVDALKDSASITWQILELAHTGDVRFFASYKIMREYELIIGREVKKQEDKSILEKFISQVEVVKITKHVRVVKWDPEDDKFINAALSANADYIISSDNHLLDLQEYDDIKILSPKDFYYFYKNQDDAEGQKEWADLFGNIIK
ncbi:MAG: putative toxin-antitoxin system toxin component, PIN family [Patescibacteria group bacterium]